MQIPVLVEPIEANGYRARSGEPFALIAEGTTAEEAVEKLKDLLVAHMASGSRIVPVEVPDTGHPWARFAGMYKDDPLFDEWQQAIAERRKQIDADPDFR